MSLRRSERLSAQLSEYYRKQFDELYVELRKITAPILPENINRMSSKSRVYYLIKSFKFGINNLAFVKKYEPEILGRPQFEKYCVMLYRKSFHWLDEINQVNMDPIFTTKLTKAVHHFRKIYEKVQWSNWVYLERQYNLDKPIMRMICNYIY